MQPCDICQYEIEVADMQIGFLARKPLLVCRACFAFWFRRCEICGTAYHKSSKIWGENTKYCRHCSETQK